MKEKIARAFGEVALALTEIFMGVIIAVICEIGAGVRKGSIKLGIVLGVAFAVTALVQLTLSRLGNGEHELYDMHREVIRVSVPTSEKSLRFVANVAGGAVGTLAMESLIVRTSFLYSLAMMMIASGLIALAEGCMVKSALVMILDKCCGKLFVGIGTIIVIIEQIVKEESISSMTMCFMVLAACSIVGAMSEMYCCEGGSKKINISYTFINGVALVMCVVEYFVLLDKATMYSMILILTEYALLVDMFGGWSRYIKGDNIHIGEQILERFGSEKDIEEYRQLKKECKQFNEELTKPDEEEKNDSEGKRNK